MSHPDVAEAAVVAMPDPRWQETALAVVVPAPGREVSADTLHEWCLRNCPEEIPHWWIPNNWTFMEQIPRTSVGKFDKKVIRARMAKAGDEMSHWAEYDYVVVNRDLDRAFADVRAILAAERLKRERQPGLSAFVRGLQAEL